MLFVNRSNNVKGINNKQTQICVRDRGSSHVKYMLEFGLIDRVVILINKSMYTNHLTLS